MKIFKTILTSMVMAGIISSTPAFAKIKTVDEFVKSDKTLIYNEPVADDIRSTNWYAKPVAVLSPSERHLKPEVMLVVVTAEGFREGFVNMVQINCKNPVKSFIQNDSLHQRNISLKESMSYPPNPWDENYVNRLPREAVEGLFQYYCL